MPSRDADAATGAQAELEARSEWFRITLASIGDAVIATDADARVTFMNGVAEALTGWPIAEAAGRPLDEIFVIVHETTRRPADNPALRALREGMVVGLANHTVLIARDGRETPIDDSAAPMRSAAGAPMGAVLVFRDVAERRRAEEANARLAAIVESSEDAIVSKALDGTILSWNGGATRIFGWTPSEAVGKSVLLIVPPERHDEERGILERLRRGERVDHFETERVTKDGRRIDVSLSISPIFNAEGEVVGASKVARDVTARKRAEAERARLAEHLRLALSAADLGTWEWDPATDEITLSPRAAEIYDVTPGTHIREEMRAAIRDEHRARARELARRAADEHVDYDIEYILDRPAKGPVWIAARGRGEYDAAGKLTRMLGVVADVSARKDAEIVLRESEARHRFFAELAAATQPLTDPAQVMATSARLLAEHVGADRCAYAEVEDESVFVITGDHARGVPSIVGRWPVAAFGPACVRAMLANEPFVVEDTDADPRLTEAELPAYRATTIRSVICVPLHKDGRFTAAMAVHQQEPRRWTAAEIALVTSVVARCWEALERSRVTEELRDTDRRKDEFIALLAHELRNPLAPIRNGLSILQIADDEAERDQVRAMMDRQLSHMVRLIDDLLDVSRIGQSKMDLRRARVTLGDVVANAVETARPMIEEARHELVIALPAAPIHLDADLTRLAQVFGNLLTNSAKYTPRGGSIRISAALRGAQVAVAVSDTGIGIPAESLPRIFDMFSQVDRSIERVSGGLGIGLALVKGLVEMHGGTVTAESAGQGLGSTFTVTLPALPEQPARGAAAGPARRPPPGPRRRILVVDDNRDAADSLAMMLRLLGNEVETANDGVAAIETAERFRPEIIFMDVGMPRLSGYEATKLIREKAWSKGVAIFALTGWGQDGDRQSSREAGCDGHLVKPVHVPDLKKLLAELGKQQS